MPETEKFSLRSQNIQKVAFSFSNTFFGHVEWRFDKPAENFLPKDWCLFAQHWKRNRKECSSDNFPAQILPEGRYLSAQFPKMKKWEIFIRTKISSKIFFRNIDCSFNNPAEKLFDEGLIFFQSSKMNRKPIWSNKQTSCRVIPCKFRMQFWQFCLKTFDRRLQFSTSCSQLVLKQGFFGKKIIKFFLWTLGI